MNRDLGNNTKAGKSYVLFFIDQGLAILLPGPLEV